MKEGSFKKWLKEHYGNRAFKSNGKISKEFVRAHMKDWSVTIRHKATFFLNFNKR